MMICHCCQSNPHTPGCPYIEYLVESDGPEFAVFVTNANIRKTLPDLADSYPPAIVVDVPGTCCSGSMTFAQATKLRAELDVALAAMRVYEASK